VISDPSKEQTVLGLKTENQDGNKNGGTQLSIEDTRCPTST